MSLVLILTSNFSSRVYSSHKLLKDIINELVYEGNPAEEIKTDSNACI